MQLTTRFEGFSLVSAITKKSDMRHPQKVSAGVALLGALEERRGPRFEVQLAALS